MGALPRPDLPPGPHRELVEALHDLHHRAGWPSLRTLARETGVSHTTVSHAFSSPRVPAWGTLELLVEAMGGDTATFHDLWLAATSPPPATAGAATPRIAGRTDELAAVRRHLETGTGLFLVTGEAGIGKTTLVTTAARATDVVVATGRCLPLSTQVPLMPVVDVLRHVHDVEDARWWDDGPGALSPLRGAVRSRSSSRSSGPRPRRRTTSRDSACSPSIASAVAALAAVRPLAILLEDLHWADSSTLDVLEHLLSHVPAARVLATFRTADPDIPGATLDRLARLRLVAGPQCIGLAPLDRSATRQQLGLALGRAPDPGLVDEIHGRTRGHPLFTAQLATAGPETLALGLAGMFDHRLRELGPDGWAVARALGVADRALSPEALGEASGLALDRVLAVLHQLSDQWLLAPPDGAQTVSLRHPLIAEAIRRRLAPGEAGTQHRRVADALAARADAEPGEIARHWHAAGDRQHEVVWRRAAAERAAARFATREALDHWSRVLELWPAIDAEALGMSFAQALCRAIDAANSEGDFDTEQRLVALAETVEGTPFERAALLTRAGDTQYMLGNEERGMALLDRALALHSALPPSPELVDCLSTHILFLNLQGRYEESDAAIARAPRGAGRRRRRRGPEPHPELGVGAGAGRGGPRAGPRLLARGARGRRRLRGPVRPARRHRHRDQHDARARRPGGRDRRDGGARPSSWCPGGTSPSTPPRSCSPSSARPTCGRAMSSGPPRWWAPTWAARSTRRRTRCTPSGWSWPVSRAGSTRRWSGSTSWTGSGSTGTATGSRRRPRWPRSSSGPGSSPRPRRAST